jgi:hypothetical protein
LDLKNQLHQTITDIWISVLKEDYLNGYLLLEDSLKCAFYFHLRNEFEKIGLLEQGYRIYTEFRLPKVIEIENKRVDIAIVKPSNPQYFKYSLWDNGCEVTALIELKFKGVHYKSYRAFMEDIFKVMEYSSKLDDTLIYVCSIDEKDYNHSLSWLNNVPNEGKLYAERVTELIGYWKENGKFKMEINKFK